MSKNLTSLVIDALEELGQIKALLPLLEISLDLDYPTPQTTADRYELLVSSFVTMSEPWFENLTFSLERIKN